MTDSGATTSTSAGWWARTVTPLPWAHEVELEELGELLRVCDVLVCGHRPVVAAGSHREHA